MIIPIFKLESTIEHLKCLRSQIEMAEMNEEQIIRDKHICIARNACSAYATRIPEEILSILIAEVGLPAINLQSESDIINCIEVLEDIRVFRIE